MSDGTVRQALEVLGIEVTDVTGDELQAHCPAHLARTGKEDANPSWYINAESGKHICFSCGFKGSLEYLFVVVRGYDDAQAQRAVDNLDSHFDPSMVLDRLHTPAELDALLVARPTRRIPESQMTLFVDPPAWALRARGLKAWAASYYGVRWHPTKDAWITPLRDPDGHLMGWQEKGQLDRWFSNRPPNIRKSATLFGWQTVAHETVVVVESPLDAVRIIGVAEHVSAVAICGSRTSREQLRLLCTLRRVIAAFDNPKLDKAGRQASHELLKAADRYGVNVSFFAYGDLEVKDPGEMSANEIRAGIENARHWVYGRKAVSA